MPARTGAEFLDRLSRTRTHVEIQGETLNGGVADHPAFKNVVRTYAGLFDLQQTAEYRNIMTYPSPATGDRVATSFLIPRLMKTVGSTPANAAATAPQASPRRPAACQPTARVVAMIQFLGSSR